jgi:hypothetical protein
MKIGDKVKFVRLPESLPGTSEFVFQRCLGHELLISGFNEIGWAELDIAPLTGSVGESIWVEPEFLELVPASPL